jgi:hypothetical protein
MSLSFIQSILSKGKETTLWLSLILVGGSAGTAMAIEEPAFTVIKKEASFEVRAYDPYCLAETTVYTDDFSDAGNVGFRRLFRYIQGENQSQTKIPMTAPVGLEKPPSEKIPMTAPVAQSATSAGYRVWFVMPQGATLDRLPKPTNPQVEIRCLPARHVAVIRYSGGWGKSRYEAHTAKLLDWIKKQNLSPQGPPVLSRYNSPFSLWFLRRNEVQVDVR